LAARDFIKAHLFTGNSVAWGLILGAIYILVIERLHPATTVESAEAIPLRTAFGVGIAQILALFPGFSRSGATIMSAYALGCSRKASAEFSFFLAVPIMFAATGLDLYKSRHLLTTADLPIFAVGMWWPSSARCWCSGRSSSLSPPQFRAGSRGIGWQSVR